MKLPSIKSINLKDITIKQSLYFFLTATLLNLILSGSLYYFNQFQSFKTEVSKIGEFTVNALKEKNIELKIKKEDIELNSESVLIENKDFPISLNTKNLIYISKTANLADFKDKEVLAIINSKELVFKLDGDFQNVPLNNFLGEASEIVINKDSVQTYIDKLDINGKGFMMNLFVAFGIERVIFYLVQFAWGLLILTFCVYNLLKLSGYNVDKNNIKALAVGYYAVFIIVEPIITFARFPLNFVHVFIIGFFTLGLYLKFTLDKNLKNTK